MAISSSVPYHLVAGARAGFLQAFQAATPMWQRIAQRVDLGVKSTDLVDLGAVPMPKNSKSGFTMQDFIEKHITVTPDDWDITVHVSRNAVRDDQTGLLDRRVRSAGERYQQHFDKLCFAALNAGDGTTYGNGYDGTTFFANSHIDKGATYTTAQDNLNALGLTLSNFNTVWTAAMNFRDDHGEPSRYNYDLLVVPPALALSAAQITDNAEDATTSNRAINPFNGKVQYVVSQDFDATAWALVASGHAIKPILLVMRQEPGLLPEDAWFDPNQPDGGFYMFKFTARYNVFYGDWRLAILGNT
jgi:phage major head subunit gpT-like protein